VRKTAPETIGIKFEPVPLQGLNPGRKTLGELTYVAGFHLTSGDKRFGGLSGLEVLDDGNLLAVSDQGDFVWVDLGKDGVTPAGARIAPLRDARGGVLRGKADGDAEGVAITDGMALVSFERNHRVLAYDLAACGAAARGAPIVFGGHGLRLPDAFAAEKLTVGSNQGPEALAVAPGWYLFTGIETKVGKASALSARPIEAPPRFNLRLGESAPEIVGLDLAPAGKDGDDVRAFSLHRSTSPLATNVISVVETYFERYLDQANLPARILSEVDERSRYRFRAKSSRRLADMNLFVTLDNFEGIAAKELPDGRVRLFIISDDNFSASQRTLMMVFDVAKPG
jgi:hypothetical protein